MWMELQIQLQSVLTDGAPIFWRHQQIIKGGNAALFFCWSRTPIRNSATRDARKVLAGIARL